MTENSHTVGWDMKATVTDGFRMPGVRRARDPDFSRVEVRESGKVPRGDNLAINPETK
ncbi:hypothetical protein FHS09_001992 [Microbulbifer rhizosphaerae]|uniref:Uncharacterized protein n=1 Tax=Microbulbifer rhizosphaerae TaxID=1562603 RepID=A0A7W4WBE9_9GAMM|nr:hypothetical protein [Microbulbifer rhizosphaerae]